MIENNTLFLSEKPFYTIQGEGKMAGTNAIFIRFATCNIHCKFCDTDTLNGKGISYTYKEVSDYINTIDKAEIEVEEMGLVSRQLIHLVFTGGEPLLFMDSIIKFINFLKKTIPNPYIEIETNGTIKPYDEFDKEVYIYNISPKLKNSKMRRSLRVNDEAMSHFKNNPKAFFKFVINNVTDLVEAEETYIMPYNLDKYKCFLMPMVKSKNHYNNAFENIIVIGKLFGYRISPRLQIQLWGNEKGV